MKHFYFLFSLCTLSGTLGRPTGSPNARRATKPYSVWMADSIYARGQGLGVSSTGTPLISYEHGTFQHALRELYAVTKNETYLAWVKQGVDKVVTSTGDIIGNYDLKQYILDDIRIGESILELYKSTGEQKYRTAADTFRSQMETHPRTAEGGYWHKLRYPNQQWLDGVYMSHGFYSQYAALFESGNNTVLDDIGLQFELIWDRCQDEKTGLLRHGYDYSKSTVWADPDSGASPEVWDRAVGWYIMALVDILELPSAIPRDHPTYNRLLDQLKQLVPALVPNADPETGGWSLVMSQPHNRPGNYIESSGSAMFVYGMLKAIRLGLVEDEDGSITAAAKRGYEYIVDRYIIENADGTISLNGTVRVGSLNEAGDYAYYTAVPIVLNDLKGTSPFVMASLEYERLSK